MSFQDSKGLALRDTILKIIQEPRTRLGTLLSPTVSRANKVLTLSKLVLAHKDLINWNFDGLETFFNVCVASLDSSNFN